MKGIKISNEFKIGLAAIVALVVLVVGIQYLKGINMLRQGRYYYVACENVDGLNISSHVMLNGYQVGLVRDMHYDYDRTGKVIVLINVEDGLKLTADSHAEVVTDLLGTASINLRQGTAADLLATYDTISGGEKATGLMDAARPMAASVDALLPKLDSLISGLNVLVNESKVHESLLDINRLATQLNTTATLLNKMLRDDVPPLLDEATQAARNLDQITGEVKDANVAQVLRDANTTLQQASLWLESAQSQQSTVGKLTTSTELHDQLTETLARVDSLVDDIRQNPKRYINVKVFGK